MLIRMQDVFGDVFVRCKLVKKAENFHKFDSRENLSLRDSSCQIVGL